MEDSAVIWRNYLYVADNGGKLMCWDLNTMKLVWVQNVLDDTNTTPVFEESPQDGTCYIYISTSLHITATGDADPGRAASPSGRSTRRPARSCGRRRVPVLHGQRRLRRGAGHAGPRQERHLEPRDLSHRPHARRRTAASWWRSTRTPAKRCGGPAQPLHLEFAGGGVHAEGKSYIVQCDSVGNMFLIEGTTGKIVDTIDLGANIEASPAVFGDTIVVGTRGQKIFAVKIK